METETAVITRTDLTAEAGNTLEVSAVTRTAPFNLIPPEITGSGHAGQEHACSTGGWGGDPKNLVAVCRFWGLPEW